LFILPVLLLALLAEKKPTMRGRLKKQQGTTSSAAAPVKGRESNKEKEKEASKVKEAREIGREPARGRPRRRGKETVTEMGRDGKEPAKEKQKKPQGTGKGKGKDKETEVIEVGEQNDREKETEVIEAAEKNVCPQFFKVFFPEQSRERLVSFFTPSIIPSPVLFN
jgi:hypothetical protein